MQANSYVHRRHIDGSISHGKEGGREKQRPTDLVLVVELVHARVEGGVVQRAVRPVEDEVLDDLLVCFFVVGGSGVRYMCNRGPGRATISIVVCQVNQRNAPGT